MKSSPTFSELKSRERQLLSAAAEFEHQARRVRDRLERSGGRSLAHETELRRIEENLELTRRDLARVRGVIAGLENRRS